MRAESPTKTISAVMGLTAFTLAAIAGWAVHNPLSTILTRSIVAMVVCYAVGQILAWAWAKVAHEHINAYRASHQIPISPSTQAQAQTQDLTQPSDAQDPRNPDNPTPETPEAELTHAAA